MKNDNWVKYIEQQYLLYQNREKASKNWYEFADYLGVDDATMSHWKKGRRVPSGELLDRVAAKLGTGAYEAAGKPARVPDNPRLKIINALMPRLPDNVQESIAALVEEATEQAEDPSIKNITLNFQFSAAD